MRYELKFLGRLVIDGDGTPPPEMVERIVDEAVAELEQLEADDIDVSTNLSEAVVSITISLEGDDLLATQERGSAKIRAAFHKAGAGTPHWSVSWIEISARDADQLVDA